MTNNIELKRKRIKVKIYNTVTPHTSLAQLITGKHIKYLSNVGGTCYIVTHQ